MNDDPRLIKAIIMVIRQYDRAKRMEGIHNPLAWALYQTWKEHDR